MKYLHQVEDGLDVTHGMRPIERTLVEVDVGRGEVYREGLRDYAAEERLRYMFSGEPLTAKFARKLSKHFGGP
jgi:hypothetical protein